MKRRFAFFVFFVLGSFAAFSQVGWGPWQSLYVDSNITVDLQFYYSENSCEDGGKPFKYRYKLNGTISEDAQYVVWKMDYINCYGGASYEKSSIAIGGIEELKIYGLDKLVDMIVYDPLSSKFICSALVVPFYDVGLSPTRVSIVGNRMVPFSKEPTGIEGKLGISFGQSATIGVKGGLLGQEAEWIWYKGSCGYNRVGAGETIVLNPSETTTYFVRAEGANNTTECLRFTITVDQSSRAPAGIKAVEKICIGDSTTLIAQGGRLGLGADWIWHTTSCDGQIIGHGNSLKVSPDETTTYFVNAEGEINITECATIEIEVAEPSKEPNQITLTGSNIICEGEKIKLKVGGGRISDGSNWVWYNGDCGGTPIDSGYYVEFTPNFSTTYFVRAEGFCNTTLCASIGITVNNKSVLGIISAPEHIFRNRKTTYNVTGGTLGKNAQWLWYRGSCSSGKQIGKGQSIKIRTRIPTKYFVKAEGLCNETKCHSVVVEPLKSRQWDHKYSPKLPMYSKYKKVLQVGISAGVEGQQFADYGKALTTNSDGISTQNDSSNISIKGIGLKFEIPIYSFVKDRLSIGVIPAYSFGYLPSFVSANLDKDAEETYFYQRMQLETELAFGLEPLKILLKLKRAYETNNYNGVESKSGIESSKYTYKRNTNREILSLGLRFGSHSYYENYKQKNTIDLISTFSRTDLTDLSLFSIDDYAHLTEWNFGAGLVWWRQKLKFSFNVTFNEFQNILDYKQLNFNDALFEVSFVYNYKWFY